MDEIIMKRDNASKRRLSISFRLPILFIVSFIVIVLIVVELVYLRFEKRTTAEYTAMGESATMLMTGAFDPDKVQLYIDQNFALEEYNEIRQNLVFLKNNYPDVMYMYVYRFIPEGGIVVFDLDSDYSLDADPPGAIYDPDPAVVPYMEDLCAGKEIPVLTGNTDDGYMLTYMRPVHDSQGNYSCHVCVDFSMETLHREDQSFAFNLLVGLFLVMIGIAAIDIRYIRADITGPINRMKQATDSFSYENEADHQNNIQIMEKLNINTGDEIEVIYRLFITLMKNNLNFLRNLHQAENDIKDKDAQIGQISQDAYRDSLTSVGSKAAYVKKVEEINAGLRDGMSDIAIVMVDMNNLKRINDEYGHEYGDLYIKGCCKMVCDCFGHSPVYRIGGDEFVVFLSGRDYENRRRLVKSLRDAFLAAYKDTGRSPWLRYSAALGLAELAPEDGVFEALFKRADQVMYEEKKAFKAQYGRYR